MTKKALSAIEKADGKKDKSNEEKSTTQSSQSQLGEEVLKRIEDDGLADFENKGLEWVMEMLNNKDDSKPVYFPKEWGSVVAEEICKQPFYASHKAWLDEATKKGLTQCSAVITRPVAQKLALTKMDMIDKAFQLMDRSKTDKNVQMESFVKEIMDPQIYIHLFGSHRLTAAPDYGLVECHLCLDGETLFYGMEHGTLPADQNKCADDCLNAIGKMNVVEFLDKCNMKCRLSPGAS